MSEKTTLVRGCTATAPAHFSYLWLPYKKSAHPPISIFPSFDGKRNTIPCARLDMQEEAVHINARLVRMSELAN